MFSLTDKDINVFLTIKELFIQDKNGKEVIEPFEETLTDKFSVKTLKSCSPFVIKAQLVWKSIPVQSFNQNNLMVLASPPLWTKPYPLSDLKEVDTKEDEIQFNLEGKVSHFKVNFCNNRTFKY